MTDVGKGPFTVAKPPVEVEGLPQKMLILDSSGAVFARVHAEECAGRDLLAAKARATRIADALNAQDGFGPPRPYVDDQGNLRAPAGFGFVANGERVEMVPLVNVVMSPTA